VKESISVVRKSEVRVESWARGMVKNIRIATAVENRYLYMFGGVFLWSFSRVR
jgi:hypothetical protein